MARHSTSRLATGCDARMRMAGVTSPQRRLRACRRSRLIGAHGSGGRPARRGGRPAVDDCTSDGWPQSPGTAAERRPSAASHARTHAAVTEQYCLADPLQQQQHRRRDDRRQLPGRGRPPDGPCSPSGLTAGVDIFAFAGTTERTLRPPSVRRTCFVARQRSHARDRNINCANNEVTSVGD